MILVSELLLANFGISWVLLMLYAPLRNYSPWGIWRWLQNTRPLLEYDRPHSTMAAAAADQSYSSVAFGCWQLGNKASTGDYWGTEYTDDMAIKMVNPRSSARSAPRCLVLTS